ncbi:PREDICTED: protein arginine N-methyltransferase 5 [Nicrophorus vespilloides]|uniref:Protein arginine N-methyltransferase n=1 Tax=Nicrophorus vespilloides TaxID=110193 RepID=A0ABM1N6V2_NICVS|nr:PREDICTED: protein arginine N-methyltransferase 5 [Nicrophorus vespilloides]XP_017782553.1 PREDICTED: protein arginine N-methyltransferase 5 [Nicrophorus vespilloides]
MSEQNEFKKHMSCALDIGEPLNLLASLTTACNEGYHFVVTKLIHPNHERDLYSKDAPRVIGRTDRLLSSNDWNKLIVCRLSKQFQIDSEIENIREHDKKLLSQELGFACHLYIPAILIKLVQRDNKNLAHLLNCKLQAGASFQVWVETPMVNPAKKSPIVNNEDCDDIWEWWNDFRRYGNYHKRIGLALVMPTDGCMLDDLEIKRWGGEPVKAIIIPTCLFISNQHKQPVLPRVYQEIIKQFLHLDVQYIISGPRFKHTYQQYCSYMGYLGKKLYDQSVIGEFSMGCEDFLQSPLQPLTEHLETPIYEIFEKDSIKYVLYQQAIEKALCDIAKNISPIVVIVVGAGRGPLVQATLNASIITQRKVKVYAVEKNPYAVNTLEERIANEWNDQVTLFNEDMRVCEPPEHADILVSELLGSFGDNELSPECLDGAQRFLKPNGISIPQSYTSYLAPLQSIKLYNEIGMSKTADKTLQVLYETPYVVHLVNAYQITNAKDLFVFEHPNRSDMIINERMRTLKFTAEQNCVLTAFAGFFESVLYKDVILSTNPVTHSRNMVSWFPIMFPLPFPVQVKTNEQIEVTFWRAENNEKVWYEWCLNSPFMGSISNIAGRSYFIKKH